MFKRYKVAFLIPVFGLVFFGWHAVRAQLQANTVPSGSIFRCNNTRPVYYKGSDGKRYLFQDDVTFKTWYPNYNRVINIPQSSCDAILFGGNVTVRPGSVLLRIENTQTIYAVAAPNVLRWVSNTDVARALYPSFNRSRPDAGWQSRTRILNQSFVSNYVIGEPLTASSQNSSAFRPSRESANAPNFNRILALSSSSVARNSQNNLPSRSAVRPSVNSANGTRSLGHNPVRRTGGGGGGGNSNSVGNSSPNTTDAQNNSTENSGNTNQNTNTTADDTQTQNQNNTQNTQNNTQDNASNNSNQNQNSQNNTQNNNTANPNRTSAAASGISDVSRVVAQSTLSLPAVNEWFTDPAFGTRIKRVTDRVRLSNNDFGTPIYSQLQAFSADNQHILLIQNGDYLVNRFDTLDEARINLPDINAPRWQPARPNTIVAYDSNADNVLRVMYYFIGSNTPETVFTFPIPYMRIRANQSNDELSHDGRWMTGMATLSTNEGEQMMFALDLQNRTLGAQVRLRALYNGTCPRTPDANESSDPVDWIAASPSGRHMVVQWKRDGTSRCSGLEAFDMRTGAFAGRIHDGHQHGDLGEDSQGDFFMTFETQDTPNGDPYLSVRRLPGTLTGAAPRQLLTRLSWNQSGWHISCQATMSPFCSVVLGGNPSEPMGGEIILQYTDGRVLRLAHHRSTSCGYWVQPRATVSRDARYIAFASDWGTRRCAASNDNLGRGEAYVLELPVNVASGPAPQTTATQNNQNNQNQTNNQTNDTNTPPTTPSPDGMSFFVTSRGIGNGGNFGGLSGADAFCAELANRSPQITARGKTWRAYLSARSPLTHARVRVGTGPWTNFSGRVITASDFASGIAYNDLLDEKGETVQRSNEHDIVTGSDSSGNLAIIDGNPHTCSDWTVGTDNAATTVGHADWNIRAGESPISQHTVNCSQQSFNQSAGVGRLYCFAVSASTNNQSTNTNSTTTPDNTNTTPPPNSANNTNTSNNTGSQANQVGSSPLPTSTYMTGADSVNFGLASADWFSPVRGADFVKIAFSHAMGAPLSANECNAASDFMKYDLYLATGSSANYALIASHRGQFGGSDFSSTNGSGKETSGECTKGTFVYKIIMPSGTNNVAICISNANDPSQRYCRVMQVSTQP